MRFLAYPPAGQKPAFGAALLLSAALVSAPLQPALAQVPALKGVDHIGINVPDLNQAVQFFTTVLGFAPVTQIGPVSLEAAWRKPNHLHAGTGSVTIKMLRAGTGASIELFEYQASAGSRQQPGGDDIGATHISFYTSNMAASVAYLRAKGVKLLSEPVVTKAGDTAGETWVYFETPWGAKMELNSYPNGKAYEQHNPAQKLWSPKDYPSTTNTSTVNSMSTSDALALVRKHQAIFSETDAIRRTQLMAEAYASDIQVVDPHEVLTGQAEVNKFIAGLQQKSPGGRFSQARPIEAHHNVAELHWQFGTADQPAQVTGSDILVLANGKVQTMYVFVDGVTAQAQVAK
jgi:catechol 2,3-dioxygenase-like lactoylglutathione lyase family enzyme